MGLAELEMKKAELFIKQRPQEEDPELFHEKKHLDLIAKNFWFHEDCRKDFTRQRKAVIQ